MLYGLFMLMLSIAGNAYVPVTGRKRTIVCGLIRLVIIISRMLY